MNGSNEHVACTECGADVTRERIKFQQEDGSILCERCYALARMRGAVRQGPVRGVVVALRLAAYAVLAVSILNVLARAAAPDYAALRGTIYGILAFLLFTGLGEGLNIALALNRQTLENGLKLDKVLESLEKINILLSGGNGSQTL